MKFLGEAQLKRVLKMNGGFGGNAQPQRSCPKAESTYMLHMWKTIWNEQPENTLEELHKNMGGTRSVEAETRAQASSESPSGI